MGPTFVFQANTDFPQTNRSEDQSYPGITPRQLLNLERVLRIEGCYLRLGGLLNPQRMRNGCDANVITAVTKVAQYSWVTIWMELMGPVLF